jgi:hypothetical protein
MIVLMIRMPIFSCFFAAYSIKVHFAGEGKEGGADEGIGKVHVRWNCSGYSFAA